MASDPALLWLWCRLVATASIRPLAWEPPHAVGAAPEKAKRQKNKTKQKKNLWDGGKAMHIGKFVVLNTFIRKRRKESNQCSKLIHLKKEELIKFRAGRIK